MNVQLLIDSIVRQTTVLIAQLATAGGARTPLARIANQVFVELAEELEGNSFRTASACLATCEADNSLACLEVWEPLAPGDGSSLSSVDLAALLDRIEGDHRAEMRYPDGSASPLSMTVSGAIAYGVSRTDNPNYALLNIPPPCRNGLAVEVAVEFATVDGLFDEHWPRVAFEILPDDRARAQPNTCDLTMHIVVGPSTFSRYLSFSIANAACDAVNDLTAVGMGSPPGPTWLAIDAESNGCEDDACCALLWVEECGMGERCRPFPRTVYDENRKCREQQTAGCRASDMACDGALTSARDREGRCWLFANLPRTFTDVTSSDPTCAEQVQSAPVCD